MKNYITVAMMAVLASTSATTSQAEPFTPIATVSPEQRIVDGHALDVIGAMPGMTPEQIRLALSQTYGDSVEILERGYRMGKDNVWAETTPFPQEAHADNFTDAADTFRAEFSGPSGGNRAVITERRVEFTASGPTEETLHSALIGKYGQPSFQTSYAGDQFYIWQFKDGAQIPCDDRSCVRPPETYDYMRDGQEAPKMDYIIKALISDGAFRQPNPLAMTITIADTQLIYEAAQADFTAMKNEWDHLNAITAPIAAPKL